MVSYPISAPWLLTGGQGRESLHGRGSVAFVLGAGGPLLASFYFDVAGDYNGAFLAVAALSFVSAVLMLLVRRPSRSW